MSMKTASLGLGVALVGSWVSRLTRRGARSLGSVSSKHEDRHHHTTWSQGEREGAPQSRLPMAWEPRSPRCPHYRRKA